VITEIMIFIAHIIKCIYPYF